VRDPQTTGVAAPDPRLARLFAADGPLAERVEGFGPRPQQLEMADAILHAIEGGDALVVEAGTGTGKTFAYLVPAILAGGKVIVSTGTKNLQDQLFERDLPTVRKALATGATAALLKGRANYVCLYRLERARSDARLATREAVAQLHRIERFAALTRNGDRAELADVPEDAPVWTHATSTRDNCLGQSCTRYRDCFVMRARKNALDADVVVVNHHLFFADVVLRDEGVAELLPACNTVIFDEAHQLPDTARLFFGETLSSGQLLDLARDVRLELRAAGGASPELETQAGGLEKAARELRLAFDADATRMGWSQARRRPAFEKALGALEKALGGLAEGLDAQAERSEGLAACARRARETEGRIERLRASDDEDAAQVRWVEVFSQAVQLHLTPLSAAAPFQRQLQGHPRAWIFTSATLAVGDDFRHFTRELGLEAARSERWPSPFDYERQARLYVPRGLPENPNDPDYTDAVVEAALPVLKASRGRAFLLFTSLRALRRAHERLQDEAIEHPLLVQGTGSRSELLRRFRELGDAVLLGSQSFWEGVDVRGEALSLVVIDKLPFAPPDDPVLAARIDALRARKENPFSQLQLPMAVLQLKQGAGRLIRDFTDRGVLMICDPRLFTRGYGRVIRASLPPMPLTRELGEVERFFAVQRSATIGARSGGSDEASTAGDLTETQA
jgi:ATP-dependent DNA helicase DinG